MKNLKLLLFIFFFAALNLVAEEYLDLNFFIEPRFDPDDINLINFHLKNVYNDSISQVNILAGRIIKKPVPDSLTINFINYLQPDIAVPTDFHFRYHDVTFDLLMSNVKHDSIRILEKHILQTDSMKIGFFSIYTPDWIVKNKLEDHCNFDYDFFELSRKIAHELASQTDFVILLSNLSKYIDEDITRNLPIDAVISFDYQKSVNTRWNKGKTHFYSIQSRDGFFGRLRLKCDQQRISQNWYEVVFPIRDK